MNLWAKTVRAASCCALIGQAMLGLAVPQEAQHFTALKAETLPVLNRSLTLGHSNPSRQLHLAIALQPRDRAGLERFVADVSDPASPNYRHYISPETVGAQFGLPAASVQQVSDYLTSNGMTVRFVGKNRMAILADATVAQAERAFHTTINEFATIFNGEPGRSRFFANAIPASAPSSISRLIVTVSGLQNFTKPEFRGTLSPTQARTLYSTASAYGAGMQGQGRSVAISNYDGFRLTNVPLYYTKYALPTPAGGVLSNVTVVHVDSGAGSGATNVEGDLDIQMVLGMAPLCNLYIYDDGSDDLISVLAREASDNLADVVTESYGWSLDPFTAVAAHDEHLSMSAQGITYMAASGDSGTSLEPYSYPDYDPEVLMVGGTVATCDASGNRLSEVSWSGSGGGWSTTSVDFNVLPAWQKGTGVPTTINYRLVPDVAIHASGGGGGAYPFYYGGNLTTGYIGTSFASPVFAGSLAVAEQKLISLGGLTPDAKGKQRFGRIQDLFYSQNGRSDVWYDITSGSNGKLPNGLTSTAGAGWDTVTGWGAINFDAFVNSQAKVAVPAPPATLTATPGVLTVSLAWSASATATSYSVKRATVSGGPYSTIATVSNTSYTDAAVTYGTTYYYVVTAINASGESAPSVQASATPKLPANLILNPGFELGNVNWGGSSGVITNSTSEAAHSGTWKAWLGGKGVANISTLSQTVTIPSTITSATLSFWVHIDSADPGTAANDIMRLDIKNTSGSVLSTPNTWSNRSKGAGFAQKSFDLSAFKGKTIQIVFTATEDGSFQTSWVLDDFVLSTK